MKRTALLLVTAFALIVSGCGGNSEENDYVKEINAADLQAQAALKRTGTPATSARGTAKRFDDTADKLEPVIAQYKAINAPDSAKKAHARTVAGMVGLVALFREIADDFRAAKTQTQINKIAARTADFDSEEPFRQLKAARKELAKAGYKVEGASGS